MRTRVGPVGTHDMTEDRRTTVIVGAIMEYASLDLKIDQANSEQRRIHGMQLGLRQSEGGS